MKLSLDQAIRKNLLKTPQAPFDMYLQVCFDMDSNMSPSTYERGFRRWREANPDDFKTVKQKARSKAIYHKYAKNKNTIKKGDK